ncbi:DUF349 domain-containing protein [Sinomicrobium soli]|uniref:DUF349 domain-containing protein n=1 Tax=Sinomicrobium sp. N-1-3-6 TaxID=2219864 RepID=UPI000DCF4CEE|nr:DUF349 domain-containing protein [Sinomicrobium sp. N-1-3-6]RAV29997.1 DUF349 domain-containing protein [Sinomicrobium sp. N-1-3-6]
MLDQNEKDLHRPDEQEEVKNTGGEAGNVSHTENTAPESPPEPLPGAASDDTTGPEKTAAPTGNGDDARAIDEIDESNAEDAEDEDNVKRHSIPMPDYHAMSVEKLVSELEKLLRSEKVQAIKEHADHIKYEFDQKFQEIHDEKKEEFLHDGGNEIDFRYHPPIKQKFNKVYGEYRDKRNQYYQNLEQNLKNNLAKRQEIIEALKGLISVEEDINTTYKHFKELQDRWRVAGPVPRVNYNDVWRTYHHHVERFYDFLDLNRDLRDLDFKHNLEEKEKIISRAEELAAIPDVNIAFRELQSLHKIWKEDLGPVDREHREDIWNRFSAATRVIHERRQQYFKEMDKVHEQNLERKRGIIEKINTIVRNKAGSHRQWQKQIGEIKELREAFFNAGRVPRNVSDEIWTAFKTATRSFNRQKNEFYKNLKREQQENLTRKKELIRIARENMDSEDWEVVTPLMKKIQNDWKKIGHVPRRYSDRVWDEFKSACNHYFDRLHTNRNRGSKEETEALQNKEKLMDRLRDFQLGDSRQDDLETLSGIVSNWRSYGKVPHFKRNIESKFNKIIDALLKKLQVSRQDIELIKYGNKLEELANSDKDGLIDNEKIFIRRKIDEVKNEIRQLENNLQFINADDDNPIVKEVNRNIDKQKESLALWKAKLQQLRKID